MALSCRSAQPWLVSPFLSFSEDDAQEPSGGSFCNKGSYKRRLSPVTRLWIAGKVANHLQHLWQSWVNYTIAMCLTLRSQSDFKLCATAVWKLNAKGVRALDFISCDRGTFFALDVQINDNIWKRVH